MKRKGFNVLFALVLVVSFSMVTAVPVAADDGAPLSGYEVITSPAMAFSDGGWGGWSVPAGKVVLGGGFYSTGPAAVSAPGTPNSVWPHYTYGPNEYGWCVRDAQEGHSSPGSYVYAIYADEPAGYGIVQSVPLNYSDGGWGGWSVPAGKVVLGGGFWLTGGPAAVSAPGTPNSVWPHYTYGPNEYGWCVRDAQEGHSSPGSYVYAIYAYAATRVDIDIQPGSDPNSINLGSQGVVPVAILGSADFDASTVDPLTIMLAGASVRLKGKSGNAGSLEDANGDGYLDLVVQVYTSDFAPGDGTAELTGETYDGLPIHGTDSVRIVPE
jgi:hypothetical protein